MQPLNVGIYIYDDAEVLDFSGPFEVFSTAARLSGTEKPFNPFLIAESQSAVRARGNFQVVPHYSTSDHPDIDVLIVSGGVHHHEVSKPGVISWISKVAEKAQLTTAVCTGAFLLAEAGLLSHRQVTTHWEDQADLQASYPTLTVIPSQRWIKDGSIVTSGGISAGIDMSLYLVSILANNTLAQNTARQMEYDWRDTTFS